MKPYCETVDNGVQIAVEHMFHHENWDVCVRNGEYMVYSGASGDYIPTCVGGGPVGAKCDTSLVIFVYRKKASMICLIIKFVYLEMFL